MIAAFEPDPDPPGSVSVPPAGPPTPTRRARASPLTIPAGGSGSVGVNEGDRRAFSLPSQRLPTPPASQGLPAAAYPDPASGTEGPGPSELSRAGRRVDDRPHPSNSFEAHASCELSVLSVHEG
jgi:hypothetical protein